MERQNLMESTFLFDVCVDLFWCMPLLCERWHSFVMVFPAFFSKLVPRRWWALLAFRKAGSPVFHLLPEPVVCWKWRGRRVQTISSTTYLPFLSLQCVWCVCWWSETCFVPSVLQRVNWSLCSYHALWEGKTQWQWAPYSSVCHSTLPEQGQP